MRRITRFGTVAAMVAAGAIGGSAAAVSAHQPRSNHDGHGQQVKHVLLISVDGMHQSDLDWYVANHPSSALARLTRGGAEYTNDHTSDPSDSDPGGTAMMTGGDPKSTGIYYDVEYSHDVFPPGTTPAPGQPRAATSSTTRRTTRLPNVPDLINTGAANLPVLR